VTGPRRPAAPRTRWACAVVVATATLALLPAPAGADPYPSQDQVDAARTAVTTTAQQVAELESRLAGANAALEESQIAAARAGEDWNEAQVALQEAALAAVAARDAADRARAQLQVARDEIGALAAQAYRSGGSLGGLELVLGAGGPQEYLDRASTVRHLGADRQQTYQRGHAAELVSQLMDEQAVAARAAQEEAAAAAQAAKDEADRAQAAAVAQVRTTETERTAVLTELAALRSTSVELEQQRQSGLEAERVARQEAAARAAAQQREQAERDRLAREAVRASRDDDRTAPAAPAPANPAPANPAPSPANPAPANPAPSNPAPSNPAPSNPAPAPPPSNPAPAPPPGDSRGTAAGGRAAVEWARTQIGKPYQWGGTGPDAYDCSGLTGAAWRHGGVSLPRTSRSQYDAVEKISYSQLRPGDLVFYGSGSSSSSIYHVAIYSGGGRMVEAPRAGVPLRETSLRMSGTMPFAGRP
jgi:cell wall-associated NlpC family hydrolase